MEQVTISSDVPAIKFLGIHIDPQLNFKFHISQLNSKISNALYFQYQKLPSVVITFPSRKQCDQMAILIFPYLPICSNENVPNSIQKLPKKVQHFAKS